MYGADWVGFDFLGDGMALRLLAGKIEGEVFLLLFKEKRLAIYLFVDDDASIPPGHGPIYMNFFVGSFFPKSG